MSSKKEIEHVRFGTAEKKIKGKQYKGFVIDEASIRLGSADVSQYQTVEKVQNFYNDMLLKQAVSISMPGRIPFKAFIDVLAPAGLKEYDWGTTDLLDIKEDDSQVEEFEQSLNTITEF